MAGAASELELRALVNGGGDGKNRGRARGARWEGASARGREQREGRSLPLEGSRVRARTEAPQRGSVRRRPHVARGLASVGRLPSGPHWSAREGKREKPENGKDVVDPLNRFLNVAYLETYLSDLDQTQNTRNVLNFKLYDFLINSHTMFYSKI